MQQVRSQLNMIGAVNYVELVSFYCLPGVLFSTIQHKPTAFS